MGYLKATNDVRHKSDTLPFKKRYPFWQELWEVYSGHYNELQVQNWKEESEAIQELEQFSFSSQDEGLVKIQRVTLNDKIRDYFIHHSADSKEQLKWFSILFHDDHGIEGIEIRNYAEEIFFNQVTREDAEPILEMFKKYDTEAEFFPDDTD